MSVAVKGCRTPAGYKRVRRVRPAGVGQASGEATAGRHVLDHAAGTTGCRGGLTVLSLSVMGLPLSRGEVRQTPNLNTGQTHPVTAQTNSLAASNYRVAVASFGRRADMIP